MQVSNANTMPADGGSRSPAVNEDDEPDLLDVPLLDKVSMQILTLLQDDEFQMKTFASIVEQDADLAEQLVNLASSPLYGASKRFPDVQKAVVFLGLRNALSLALAFRIFQCMRQRVGSYEERWVWRRMLLNAVGCRETARAIGVIASDQAFLCGLVQDFGLLLLVQQRRPYAKLLLAHKGRRVPLSELEYETFGYTHTLVSEALLHEWKFPTTSREAVGHHHDPLPPQPGLRPRLHEVMAAGEALSDFVMAPSPITYRFWEAHLHYLGITAPHRFEELLEQTARGVGSLADILHVEFPEGVRVQGLIAAALAEEQRQAEGSQTIFQRVDDFLSPQERQAHKAEGI